MISKNKIIKIDKLQKEYFEDYSFSLDELKESIREIIPVFGKLKVVIKDINTTGGKRIIFVDEVKTDIYKADNQINTSTELFKLVLDKNNIIEIVENDFKSFNKTNKTQVLFTSALIGKTILKL